MWGVNRVGGLWSLLLPGVSVGVLLTQLLPGVPVDVLLAQPLPGVPVIHLRPYRRPVRLLLSGHLGLWISTVIMGMAAPEVRLRPLPPGLPGRPVRWVIGGCTGSSRFHGRCCGICERSWGVG